jgi:uncharacterized repeat protein (TIGR01451 family)
LDHTSGNWTATDAPEAYRYSDTDPSHYFRFAPELTITKEANVPWATVGDVIEYTINVANTGNVNLTSVLVTDVKLGLSETIPNLIPGASRTFNPSYTVTQADICAPIDNIATANGRDPCGNPVGPVSASMTVTPYYSARLSVVKEANVTSATVGTVIGYTINVTNTGNVNLRDVLVTDSLTGLYPTIPTLAPGAYHIFNTRYTVTELDICAPISNTATASGTDPCGGTVFYTDDCTIDVTIAPGIEVVKTAFLHLRSCDAWNNLVGSGRNNRRNDNACGSGVRCTFGHQHSHSQRYRPMW